MPREIVDVALNCSRRISPGGLPVQRVEGVAGSAVEGKRMGVPPRPRKSVPSRDNVTSQGLFSHHSGRGVGPLRAPLSLRSFGPRLRRALL